MAGNCEGSVSQVKASLQAGRREPLFQGSAAPSILRDEASIGDLQRRCRWLDCAHLCTMGNPEVCQLRVMFLDVSKDQTPLVQMSKAMEQQDTAIST